MAAVMPEDRVLTGEDLSSSQLEFLREKKYLRGTDEVLMLYSNGLLMIDEGAFFFTPREAVSYQIDEEGEMKVERATYASIKDIQISPSESMLENTRIRIERLDGTSFVLEVTSEEEDDKKFYELLLKHWTEKRP